MEDVEAPLLAERIGEQIRNELSERQGIAAVRGMGALVAIALDPATIAPATAATIAAELLDAGVVVNAVTPTALRLAPSLLITDDELRHGTDAIAAVVAAAAATTKEDS